MLYLITFLCATTVLLYRLQALFILFYLFTNKSCLPQCSYQACDSIVNVCTYTVVLFLVVVTSVGVLLISEKTVQEKVLKKLLGMDTYLCECVLYCCFIEYVIEKRRAGRKDGIEKLYHLEECCIV